MDHEFQELESTLKGLRPLAPGDACTERLLAAMEDRLQQGDARTAGVEGELHALQAAALSDECAARFMATLSRAAFPVDEKVVLFPGKSTVPAKPASKRPWIAAAAAVAVAGAFSALMIDGPKAPPAGPVAKQSERSVVTPKPRADGFVRAAMGSGVQDARDEGVMWTGDGQAVRKVRVIYNDRIQYRDARGSVLEVERPRVQILRIPEKID